VGDTEPEIEVTVELPCACRSCTLRRAVNDLGAPLRVTWIRSDECTELPYTVIITGLDGDKRAVGQGHDEDAALYVALKDLGAVS